ncbi:DNA primase [bacterium]|nr:DNA primase [bacterium]
MKFSEEFIDRVREASDLIEIVSQHVNLKKSGSGYQGLCPFHGEKTPSFSVSDVKQVYHCFGCKASGNVFKFVQEHQGLTFPETVEYLAQRAGIPLPIEEDKWSGGTEKREEKKTLYRINQYASEFYHQKLLKLSRTEEIWKYLSNRKLGEEEVKKYKLGWASPNWSDLSEALVRKKAPIELSEKLGLSKKRAQSSGHFDLFRSRLMFPILSPTEKCLGFGGRVIGDEHPKYLNSPDSEVFHKGQVFYGLNWSAKHIRTEDVAVVVEGYMDWIALDRQGISNVVATLGTALTERHAKLIKRYAPNVIVLFDGDSAGQTAAERSLPILLKEGLFVKGVFLPEGMDPDDFINKEGSGALKARLAKAPDLFNLLLEVERKKIGNSPSDKTKLIEKMVPYIEAVENSSLKGLYVESLADMLNVDKSVIPVDIGHRGGSQFSSRAPYQDRRAHQAGRSRWASSPGSNQTGGPQDPEGAGLARSRPEKSIDLRKATRLEIEILNVSLLKSVYLEQVLNSQALEFMPTEGVRVIFKELERLYRQDPSRFDTLPSLLSSKVEPGESVTLHLTSPFQSLTDEAAKKLIHDCIKRLHEKFLRSQSRALMNNLKGSQGSDQTEKLEQIMNIHRDRQDIKKDQKNEDQSPSIQEPNANE